MRFRLILAGLLALSAAILLAISALLSAPDAGAGRRVPSPESSAAIGAVIDTVLTRSGLDRSLLKSRKIQIPGAYRIVSRFPVSAGFSSLEFNHQLNLALAPLQARVVATERVREGTVTMHCVRFGVTVRSITFVPHAPLQAQAGGLSRTERRVP